MKMIATFVRPFLPAVIMAVVGYNNAHAQTGETPSIGGMSIGGLANMDLSLEEMQNMTPEEARAMAQKLMMQMDGQLGANPEALANATPEEQQEVIRQSAQDQAAGIMGQMEQMFGMSVQDMQNLDAKEKTELRARFSSQTQASVDRRGNLSAMRYAPPNGFQDGSIPLPVQPDFSTVLTAESPLDQEVLLVVADLTRREIVWRETRRTPFSEQFNLLELGRDPNALVLELINPQTRRVIGRFRPVAAD